MEPEITECKRCGHHEVTASPDIERLNGAIARIFDAQPGLLVTSQSVEGNPVNSYGLGVKIHCFDETTTELEIFSKLTGILSEAFRRTFGEQQTGRRLWWRERVNILHHHNQSSRTISYAIWCRFALEGLTDTERDALYYVEEGESVIYVL